MDMTVVFPWIVTSVLFVVGPVWLGFEVWLRTVTPVDAEVEELRERASGEGSTYWALVQVLADDLPRSGRVEIPKSVFEECRSEESQSDVVRVRWKGRERRSVGSGSVPVHVRTVRDRMWLRAVGWRAWSRFWWPGVLTLGWLLNVFA